MDRAHTATQHPILFSSVPEIAGAAPRQFASRGENNLADPQSQTPYASLPIPPEKERACPYRGRLRERDFLFLLSKRSLGGQHRRHKTSGRTDQIPNAQVSAANYCFSKKFFEAAAF